MELCGLKAVLKASRRRSTAGCWYGLLRCTDAGLFSLSEAKEPKVPDGVEKVLKEYEDVFGEP